MLELIYINKDYLLNNTPVHALKDISINFRPCEFASILGPSGCGKTTLLNIIGGLDRYTSGNLVINGISTRDFTDQYWDAYRNSEIGFVFQSYNLIPHLTVQKNVELALNLSGLSHAECAEKAIAALKKVHMEEHLHKKPHQLSGGQMQRVSIARALVNNPRIILADEPTGALDSELGEQVMEVLKEVSQDRLVIMVTHNDELAYRFSTRIIKIKDGGIVDDSDPFVPEEPYVEKPLPAGRKRHRLPSLRQRKREKQKAPFKFTEMKWAVAMGISWRNLISKVRRTALTTVAGSIGIIGMGLVLALSNGINIWMDNMKSSMLASVPIGVYEYSMDYDVMTDLFQTFSTGSGVSGSFPDDNQAHLVKNLSNDSSSITAMLQTMTDSIGYNDITEEFVDYLDAMPEEYYLAMHKYYGTRMNLVVKDKNATDESKRYIDVSPCTSSPDNDMMAPTTFKTKAGEVKFTALPTMAGSVLGNSTLESKGWNQLVGEHYMDKYYDVISGRYPSAKEDIVLVVNENNEVVDGLLEQFGFFEQDHNSELKSNENGKYVAVDFDEIIGHEIRLILNNDYFKTTGGDTGYYVPTSQEDLAEMYEKGVSLKVVGVLRVKESAPMSVVQCNFCYTPELGEYVMQEAKKSDIALAQKRLNAQAKENNTTNYLSVFNEQMESDILTNGGEPIMVILTLLYNGKKATAFNRFVGADSTPVYINIYADTYDGKVNITDYLDKWNNTHERGVKYFDVSEMFIHNLGTITKLATLALIAVAAISLLVSSIMIAIITSNSVTERTREIGILRSIGAKKTDILLVFIAEVIIIGALSGLLGIALTYALAPALSAIIQSKSGIAGLAVVNPIAAGSLFALSVVLAVISGLIPSLVAAHKNVVDALRSD